MKLYYHSRFKSSYEHLPRIVQQKAERKELILRKNPFDARLKTHKLHGKLKHLWSFSVDKDYRIIFELDSDDVIFLDIGTHDLYR